MRHLGVALLAIGLLAACTQSVEPVATASPVTAASASSSAPASTTSTSPTQSPAARMGHGMVAVGDGDLLVFGGRSYQGSAEVFLGDTWIYNTGGDQWRQIVGPGPFARSQYAMAYDENRDQVLLFGGYVGSSFTYGDTWVFDLEVEVWRRLDPVASPTARAGSVATYDASTDSFVMFAGAEEPTASELPLAETWLFDPEAEDWREVETATVPVLVSEGHPTLFELAMVYDSLAARSILMVAGESTWSFDVVAEDWMQVDAGNTQGLGADYMTAAAFDSARGTTIAYGGAPVARTEHTWAYHSQADVWEAVDGAALGPLANHAMAYDASTESVYLFGGAQAVLVLDGVPPVTSALWRLGDNGWEQG